MRAIETTQVLSDGSTRKGAAVQFETRWEARFDNEGTPTLAPFEMQASVTGSSTHVIERWAEAAGAAEAFAPNLVGETLKALLGRVERPSLGQVAKAVASVMAALWTDDRLVPLPRGFVIDVEADKVGIYWDSESHLVRLTAREREGFRPAERRDEAAAWTLEVWAWDRGEDAPSWRTRYANGERRTRNEHALAREAEDHQTAVGIVNSVIPTPTAVGPIDWDTQPIGGDWPERGGFRMR